MKDGNTCPRVNLFRMCKEVHVYLLILKTAWCSRYYYPNFTDETKVWIGYVIWPRALSWWLVKLGLQFCLIPRLTFSDCSPLSSGIRLSRAVGRRICNVEIAKGWISEVRMVIFWPVSQEIVGIISVWPTHKYPQSLEDGGSLPTSWLTFWALGMSVWRWARTERADLAGLRGAQYISSLLRSQLRKQHSSTMPVWGALRLLEPYPVGLSVQIKHTVAWL